MKLTSTIVGPNFNLIGFMVKGKGKEFGEMGDEVSERPMSLKYLMTTNFNNHQAYFGDGNITEKGSFHINQLKMLYSSGDVTTPINNTMELTTRYVLNNENVGFDVLFGNGETLRYKYADVIKLSELFKPINFVVRTSTTGKMFIAGSAGCPISKLPEVDIGDPRTAKKLRSGAIDPSPVTGVKVNNLDIFDLFDFVNRHKGFIINFKDTEYQPTGESIERANDRFTSLNIGEVASPYLTFNETKFNATCRFKNPGIVTVGSASSGPMFAGASIGVYSYIYRSKNIFYNAEHHLTKLGVIISEDSVLDFYNTFGSTMAIMEVTDANTISIVNRLINWKDSKIFAVDVSKLALISPSKYDNYILDINNLYRNVVMWTNTKLSLIYVRGAIKELKNYGIFTSHKNRPIAPQFALKSEKELEDIILAGVDIYDGSFYESGEKVANKNYKNGEDIPEIRYIIDGLDPKNFNYEKICDVDKCPEAVSQLIMKVQAITDLNERVKVLNDMLTELAKSEESVNKTLWLHKTSMWLKNSKLGVHKDDADRWEQNLKKRTKATCYNCNVPSASGLQILLTNVDIIK